MLNLSSEGAHNQILRQLWGCAHSKFHAHRFFFFFLATKAKFYNNSKRIHRGCSRMGGLPTYSSTTEKKTEEVGSMSFNPFCGLVYMNGWVGGNFFLSWLTTCHPRVVCYFHFRSGCAMWFLGSQLCWFALAIYVVIMPCTYGPLIFVKILLKKYSTPFLLKKKGSRINYAPLG